MKRFISAGHIEQFRNAVYAIKARTEYDGKDLQGNRIYLQRELPIVQAFGTEKIHGTFCSVNFNNSDFWLQSKENIITPEKDNACLEIRTNVQSCE